MKPIIHTLHLNKFIQILQDGGYLSCEINPSATKEVLGIINEEGTIAVDIETQKSYLIMKRGPINQNLNPHITMIEKDTYYVSYLSKYIFPRICFWKKISLQRKANRCKSILEGNLPKTMKLTMDSK